MKKSDSLSNLFTALSKAQVDLKNPDKGKTVNTGKFSYSYADLPDVLDQVKPVLSKHGLALVQGSTPGTNGMIIETLLTHDSGEWLETQLELSYESQGRMNSAQEMGSAMTYGRRYALSAILNIAADEDNDASILPVKTAPKPVSTQQTTKSTELCPKHQNSDGSAVVMTQKGSGSNTWFSHLLPDGTWCNGTDKKNVVGTTEPK